MNVKLIAYTPSPEQVISAAAKTCYSAATVDTLLDGLDEETTKSYLTMLTDIGHESPIEHASFTFAIEGVSRSLLAQITRHRMASFSVQSQRYVKENAFEFVVPHEIEDVPEAKEAFLQAMADDQKMYENLTAILQEKHMQTFLDEGCTEKEARRKAE
ncbi:FAD-dependent thymidylate synthase, partial [Butyricicoccus sp.]|uniref:FAD-dependent thymidylate synthase n=1 Tax=Butyricicoccus sp. TaxID=2049021 RepID=UPI003D7C608A